MITRLLVANRGEIAVRVIRTARELGIETVAVFSDPDADAPHVTRADLAVRLPGAAAAETYLRADLLVAAARATGADAVHPGYGFLAENADFATAVIGAGLTWVGPPPAAIAAMGDKLAAKDLLAPAGVPMLPSVTDPAQVSDFPVLVKAAGGGGGRGMRIARSSRELAEAIEAARVEAAHAFGSDVVFCERYVEDGRHIEVQIFADSHGSVVALGERECSIQRRHQKIVEETPSPAVSPALRAALFEAAIAAARAVGYVGAGTVEFLLAPSGDFFFLEMNTRLQVEHPVTEAVTGLDLVRLQLTVAAGEPLPWTEPPMPQGHAIEARLYAEDPAQSYQPSTGTLHRFAIPGPVRVDSGVTDGSVVSPHYDPMLAKVIAHAPTRERAAGVLAASLRRAQLHGVVTNRDLLVRVLTEPDFQGGATDTGYLDRHPSVFEPLLTGESARCAALLAAALATASPPDPPWGALPTDWRNLPSGPRVVSFAAPWGPADVAYTLDRSGRLAPPGPDGADQPPPSGALISRSADQVVLVVDDVRVPFAVHTVADVTYVDSPLGSVALRHVERFPVPTLSVPEGSLVAPMPGSVGRILVAAGAVVGPGETLLTLEAMKLEHSVTAPAAGVVAALLVGPGDQVETGTVLMRLEPSR